jgi:hypothetical protein
MGSSSKRQQTFAKKNREQKVREKRALKLEKKHAAAAARQAKAAESLLPTTPADVVADETETRGD